MHNVQISPEQLIDQKKEAKRIVNDGIKLAVNDNTKSCQMQILLIGYLHYKTILPIKKYFGI